MALRVTAVNPMFGNPVNGNDTGTNFTQNYNVLFDETDVSNLSANDLQLAEFLAYFANGIPKIGAVFRAKNTAFCKGKSATVRVEDQKPFSVIVTCTFSTIGTENKDQEENPLDKRPDITWQPIFEREAVTSARIIKIFQDGREIGREQGQANQGAGALEQINNFSLAITNSFGDAPNPFPEKEVAYLQWTVTENLAIYDAKQALEVLQTVNVREFSLDGERVLPGQNLITQRSASLRYQGNTSYREVTTSGILKATHDIIVLDNGPNAYFKSDPSPRFKSGQNEGGKIKRNGEEVIARLDGKGNINPDNKPDVFLHFGVYPASDHRQLNLPAVRL